MNTLLLLLTFTFVTAHPASGVKTSITCPRATCTDYDMKSFKEKGPCNGGCRIGALWGNGMVYCTPDPVRYPKYIKC